MTAARFSPAHREHVEALLAERTQVARQFSYVAALIAVSSVIGLLPPALERGVAAGAAVTVAVAALTGGLVWWLGWRRVQRMRQDLAEGRLETVTGRLDRLDRVKHAYGETITHATIGGVRHTTREALFEGFARGEALTVDRLPRSRVPLAVRHADEP